VVALSLALAEAEGAGAELVAAVVVWVVVEGEEAGSFTDDVSAPSPVFLGRGFGAGVRFVGDDDEVDTAEGEASVPFAGDMCSVLSSLVFR
jgi:hypothetical protein